MKSINPEESERFRDNFLIVALITKQENEGNSNVFHSRGQLETCMCTQGLVHKIMQRSKR